MLSFVRLRVDIRNRVFVNFALNQSIMLNSNVGNSMFVYFESLVLPTDRRKVLNIAFVNRVCKRGVMWSLYFFPFEGFDLAVD